MTTPRQLLMKSDTTSLHPTVLAEAERRASSVQLRIADAITSFAGSMRFVYLHVGLFAAWMLFFEPSPWPTLTLVVSLEAIFLSTFVMIGQNRQAAFQQAKADHDYQRSDKLLHENTQLTRAIHALTSEIHAHIIGISEPEQQMDPEGVTQSETSSMPAPTGHRNGGVIPPSKSGMTALLGKGDKPETVIPLPRTR